MKRYGLVVVVLIALITVGCTSQSGASGEGETYIESIDEFKQFNAMKLVDKETGCKYLFTRNFSSGQNTMTQMLKSDGKPLCSK